MTRSTPVEVCFTPDAQYVISGKYFTVYYNFPNCTLNSAIKCPYMYFPCRRDWYFLGSGGFCKTKQFRDNIITNMKLN